MKHVFCSLYSKQVAFRIFNGFFFLFSSLNRDRRKNKFGKFSKNLFALSIFLVLLFTCSNKKSNAPISDFIPDNAQTLLLINNIESFKTNLNNNHFIGLFTITEDYKFLRQKLDHLSEISTVNPIIISFSKSDNEKLDYTLITKNSEKGLQLDISLNPKTETIKIKDKDVLIVTYDDGEIYNIITDNVFISTSNRANLESILDKKNNVPSPFQKQLNAINKNAPFSIIVNEENPISALFYETALNSGKLTDYFSLDVALSQNKLFLSGITKAKDASSLINVFKNTIPQENETAKITPETSDGFLSFTFDNYEVFRSNLNEYNSQEDTNETTLFDNITEVGVIYEDENRVIALHSLDPSATKEALLSEQNSVQNYRQTEIYNFSDSELFKTTFSPFISFNLVSKYCILDSFFVFASSTEALQNMISNYQNETTFSSRDYYKNSIKEFSDHASILQVAKPFALQKIINSNTDDRVPLKLDAYKASILQFVYDSNFAHVYSVFRKDKKRAYNNSVTEVSNITLDNAILNQPQLVINHRTGQKEIVVQDVKNVLHLISNTGQILWKKQLNGPILGDIEQIDIYKNGYLQLVFATPHAVHVIARNGKEVSPFPLKFNDDITQPLAVFDYDKKRDYRLFVTQGKNVLLYNVQGKTVKGFDFSSAKTTINHPIQHIRMGSKDYIVIKTDDDINILTRRGKPRVMAKTKLKYDDQPVFSYKSNFVTATKDGKLATIDKNGNVTVSTLFGENTNLLTTSKTLVAQNENKLKIKSNIVDLDFATYSKPTLFYIRNKIYVSVTNLQSQKVLLFDSQGKSLPNFPVYGNSVIELDNIDRDSSLEFITQGEANNILIYEIN